MRHHDRVQAVISGTDYQAPLRAINDEIEGLVHCGLVVREHETNLTPEVRALDAIGTQVIRELKQRADMMRALVDRCNLLERRLRGEEPEELVLSDNVTAMPQLGGHTV